MLLKNGLQAKLIQSNDGFNLYNLIEVRYFLSKLNLSEDIYVISDDAWTEAKRKLRDNFYSSPNLENCFNIMNNFVLANPKTKYKSDLEIFIRESKLEDFFSGSTETIFVSTIHKAKGREFDNVFIMLNQFDIETDEALRLLYVAMTRSKLNLSIHYNRDYLDFIKTEDLEIVRDCRIYQLPRQLVIQLTFRDVWLDFFMRCQNTILQLNSGDELLVNEDGCLNSEGQVVLKFSKQLNKRIEIISQRRYVLKTAKIRFAIY